jgi:hypothetical protein
MSSIQATVPGKVVKLDPRRRVATIALPPLGGGRRTYRAAVALPGEPELATARQIGHGTSHRRTAGGVMAVRPRDTGAEVDLVVSDDASWQRLGERGVHVHAECLFDAAGADPIRGRVVSLEIS